MKTASLNFVQHPAGLVLKVIFQKDKDITNCSKANLGASGVGGVSVVVTAGERTRYLGRAMSANQEGKLNVQKMAEVQSC